LKNEDESVSTYSQGECHPNLGKPTTRLLLRTVHSSNLLLKGHDSSPKRGGQVGHSVPVGEGGRLGGVGGLRGGRSSGHSWTGTWGGGGAQMRLDKHDDDVQLYLTILYTSQALQNIISDWMRCTYNPQKSISGDTLVWYMRKFFFRP
jgi:hypothetical protein